ncbi:MAG: hypothetical protein K0S96_319 [Geminicoccaceae bacterium]|jgi:hypothetical protein|nr:hypothetical protein [Geminicoccaceae bacterium]
MLLRKQTAGGPDARDRQVVPVLAEPRPGHDEAEVVGRLRAIGASRIEVLAPGFVSASLEQGRLAELEDIAEVGIKPRKRPLGAAR